MRCIASTIKSICALLSSASPAIRSASWLARFVWSTVFLRPSVISSIVACNSSADAAWSVAPSASAWEASARLSAPADTISDESRTSFKLPSISVFVVLKDVRSVVNSPTYSSSQLVLTAKLPLLISASNPSRSAMISDSLFAISTADFTISPTSSSLSYSGNGVVKSPCEKVSNRFPKASIGSEIDFAIFPPIFTAAKHAASIISAITISITTLVIASASCVASPFCTFTSIKSWNASSAAW